MGETHTETQMHKALFLNLVMMFGSTAMQQLGKLVNPATGKTEVDLDGAQMSIDILAMLKAKTEGHLDATEARMLTETLSALQLNYVETAAAQPAGSQADAAANASAAAAGDGPAPAAEGAGGAGAAAEDKAPRFRKSYGG